MAIMYVDESGAPSHNDHTPYFVLSGVVIRDDKIKNLHRAVLDYKIENFTNETMDSEIHTYDIHHYKGNFEPLSYAKMSSLLTNLYSMINQITFYGLVVVINKRLLQAQHPSWDVLNLAWSLLIDRYHQLLWHNEGDPGWEFGFITADKTMPKIENKILKKVNKMAHHIMDSSRPVYILNPMFVDSASVYGIQVADAIAYCTLQHKLSNYDFDAYWNIVYKKLNGGYRNMREGYSYLEFPK